MAETYNLADATSTVPTITNLDTGVGTPPVHAFDFKNDNSSGVCTAGKDVTKQNPRSYAAWLLAVFGGAFTSISGVKMWFANWNIANWGTGATITGSNQTVYSQPVDNSDTGDPTMVSTYATALDLSTAALAAGTPGNSEYTRCQATIGSDAVTGRYVDSYEICVSYTVT